MRGVRGKTIPSQVTDAKRRILDEAIELVALKGFTSITVREITQACDANVASVSYHFGSKDGLVKAALLAVFAPVRGCPVRRARASSRPSRAGAGPGGRDPDRPRAAAR